jgi:hypothetical protein
LFLSISRQKEDALQASLKSLSLIEKGFFYLKQPKRMGFVTGVMDYAIWGSCQPVVVFRNEQATVVDF